MNKTCFSMITQPNILDYADTMISLIFQDLNIWEQHVFLNKVLSMNLVGLSYFLSFSSTTSPLFSPPLHFGLFHNTLIFQFPSPPLFVSLHSSPSFSAYLTTMATGDEEAVTGPCLIEDNSAMHTHVHGHTHCVFTPLMGESIHKV